MVALLEIPPKFLQVLAALPAGCVVVGWLVVDWLVVGWPLAACLAPPVWLTARCLVGWLPAPRLTGSWVLAAGCLVALDEFHCWGAEICEGKLEKLRFANAPCK